MIGVAAIAQRVARRGVLEAEAGNDVAGHGHVEVFALVGVHQQDAAETLAALLGRVVDLVTLVDLAAVDAEVGQLAERIGNDLERQRGEWLVDRRLAVQDLFLMVGPGALRRRDVERARQEVDDGVEHRLDTLVLERRTTQDRHEVEGQRAGTQRDLDLFLGDFLAGQVLLHEVVVAGRDGLEQMLAVLRCLLRHVGGNLDFVPLGAELFVVPDQGLHLDEINQADERLVGLRSACADGQVDDRGGCLQAILDHVDGAVEVGADAIHLVDEAHARHFVLVGLAPDSLGLRLDTCNRVEHGDRTVEHAQRPLDLDGEVDVARGVDDVDAVVVPNGRGRSRRDGDATLLLLRHVVHGRRAVVDLADLVALAGVVEDALGRGGLARVDVGHDADVAGALEWKFALSHLSTSLSGLLSACVSASGVRAGPNWP